MPTHLQPRRALGAVAIVLLSCNGSGNDTGPVAPVGTPAIEVSPRELVFDDGSSEAMTRTFTVANYGTADLTIFGFELGGDDALSFTVLSDDLDLELKPRDYITVDVVVEPADSAQEALLLVRSSDPARPEIEIDLSQPAMTDGGTGGEVAPGQLIDVFVLMDTAYSYSCYHPNLESFIEQLTDEIFDHFEDVAMGFGTYDDYTGVSSSWAASNGHPYELRHQISTDQDSLLGAAKGLKMVYGGDDAGSGYEALYQAAWGPGFDLDCDGSYESNHDIPPFVAEPDDAFRGVAAGVYDNGVEGTGDRPGVGWREGATRIVLFAADHLLRDPSLGHRMPEDSCDTPADFQLVIEAFTTSDTRFLGVNVYEYQSSDDTLQNQLLALARETDSWIDVDGNGVEDDPAVLYGSWNWPSIPKVLDAIEDLAVVE